MAPSMSVANMAGLLAMLPVAMAGFTPGSNKNIASYWGKPTRFSLREICILT